jgi:hypothetical protein
MYCSKVFLSFNTYFHTSEKKINMRFLSFITFLLITTNILSLTYYSDSRTSDPNNLNNWWINTNNTGPNPTNFTSGDVFVIQSGHNYTTSGAWNVTGTVRVDGSLTIQTANSLSVLTITNGGIVYGNAQTTIASVASGGQFNLNAGGRYVLNYGTTNNATTLFNGTETFATTSTLEFQNFETTNGAFVTCLGASSTNFGNVIWNIQSGSEAYNLNLSSTTSRTIAGNFTLNKTGNTGSLTWCNNANVSKLTINGNFTQTAGIFNVINTGVGSNDAIFEVLGSFNLFGGIFDVGKAFSRSSLTYLGGDVTISGGTFTNGGPNTSNMVYFTKAGNQTFTYTSGTFTTTSTPFVINNGSTVTLASNFNIDLSLTVNSGGTLNIPHPYFTSGSGTTTISGGATLKTGHLDGISTVASTGCLQTTTKSCSTTATYWYNGTSTQFSGDINATNTGNLTFDNAQGVRLNYNLIVPNSGTLTLIQGFHDLNGYTLQMGTSTANPNTLSYTAGGFYSRLNDGVFKRFIPSGVTISPSSGNYYGLFPFAKSSMQSGSVQISTTGNVTGGVISIRPTFGYESIVNCSVADGGNTILRVQEGATFDITECTMTNGTSITVSYSGGTFVNTPGGSVNNLCLPTYTGRVVGVIGTHGNSTGSIPTPTVSRTGIANMSLLNGVSFVMGTYNSNTPLTYVCNLGGTKTVGPTGNYATLTAAMSEISANGLSSSMVLELQTTYVSTGESFPILIDPFNCMGSSNTLTIRPASGATNLSISGSESTSGGILYFNKGDYVTVDGRPGGVGATSQLSIINTHTNAPVITFRNEANYNSVKYCSIKGGSVTTTQGLIFFSGSSATGTTGNKYDTLSNNIIQSQASNPFYYGVLSEGQSSGKLNSYNFIKDNRIIDFQRAAIFVSTNSDAWTISGNHLYQTTAISPTANVYGIQINTGSGYTLSGNYFGGRAVNAGGSAFVVNSSANHLFPIYLSVGSTLTTSIQGNVIRNITFNTTSSQGTNAGIFTGIYVTGAGSLNIGTTSANVVGDTTSAASNSINITSSNTGGLIQGIYTYASGSVAIQNNLIGDFATSNVTGKGYLFNGIYTGNTSTTNISSNTIGSLASSNAISIGGNLTAAGVCEFYGIYQNASGSPTIASNKIANVSVFGTGASDFFGIYNLSGATTNTITSNLIRNISIASGSNTSAQLVGIFSSASGATNVISNYIHTVTCANGFFKGIYVNNSSGNNSISLNVIGNGSVGNITISSTATCNAFTTDVVNNHGGIVLGASTNTSSLSSNVVKGISGTSGSFSYQIAGISIGNTSTPAVTITSNLVDIVGVSSNTSAASTVYGIYSGSTSTSTITNQKNIIRNLFCANTIAPTIIGWYENALNRTYINNFIAVENTTGATSYTVNSILYGLFLVNTSTGRTANFYYNTIELGASVSSNPVTAAVYQASTTANTFVYRNNVFQNNCTSTGSLVFWGVSTTPTCTMNHNFYMNSATGSSFAKVNNTGVSSGTFNSASDDYGGANSTYTTTALTINADASISPMATIYGGADLSSISGCTEDINGTKGNRNTASTNVYKGCYEGPVATYYWVGGAGNWSDFANHWAYSSGGAPVATAVPSSTIDVVFDFNSGSGQVNIASVANCKKFTCNGFTGTIAGAATLNVNDNFATVYGMNWTHTGTLNLLATSTGKTITTGNIPISSNLVLNGIGAEYTLQDNTNWAGSITLTNGAFLIAANTLTLSSNVSPSRTSGYIKATGANSTVKFENANAEVVIPSSLFFEDSIRNLTMNGAGGIHLTTDLRVTKCLTLTIGNIDIWANHMYISPTGYVTGYSAASYIQTESTGELVQQGLGPGATIGKTFFPVGHTFNSYTPVNLVNNGTSDDFSVKILSDHFANGTTGAASTTDKIDRTWFVEEAIPGGSNVTMTIQWNTAEELSGFDRSLCFISHYTNGVWDSYVTTPASGSNPWTLTRTDITSFSPFSPDEGSSLPIRLTHFQAKQMEQQVQLNWITDSEINNDFFTLERSNDGKAFFEIGRKKGAGNSATRLYYSSIDEQPLKGISYYRLKQTDFDGKYTYSHIESVYFDESKIIEGLKVYPNPSKGNDVNIELVSDLIQKAYITLRNSLGQELTNDTFDVDKGPNRYTLNYSMFTEGIYFLEIRTKEGKIHHLQLKLGE